MWNVIRGTSSKHCCSGNITMHCVGVVEPHVTVINIKVVSKNNQHDDTCGLSFIFRGSRHSFSTCFELSVSSSSGDHFFLYSQPLA